MIVLYKDIGNVYVQKQSFDFGISLKKLVEENHDEVDFIEKYKYEKYLAAYFYYATAPVNKLKIMTKLAKLELRETSNILIIDYEEEGCPKPLILKSNLELISSS